MSGRRAFSPGVTVSRRRLGAAAVVWGGPPGSRRGRGAASTQPRPTTASGSDPLRSADPPCSRSPIPEAGTAAAPIKVGLVEVALDLAAAGAASAPWLERAGGTDGGRRPVDVHPRDGIERAQAQRLTAGAPAGILSGVVGEGVPAEEGRQVVEVGQRDVGPDVGVLDGDDVLDGAVGRVAGHS